MFQRISILILLLICALPESKGQSKLSPRFDMSSGRISEVKQPGRYTLSVFDFSDFEATYPELIETIVHRHDLSKSISLDLTSQEYLNLFLQDDNVRFIDAPHLAKEEAVLEGADFNWNAVRKSQLDFPDIRGLGQTVSIKERAFQKDDIDLINKNISLGLESNEVSRHATDMATIIAGLGNTSRDFLGILPEAQLVSSDFNQLLPDDELLMKNQKIHVQNHSYGVGIENYYGIEAYAYDVSIVNYPELLHVFSAGNAGKSNPTSGRYANLPVANLTGNFKQAKNLLVVSAVDTSFQVSDFNSRGPAYDGRIKPELTAFGGGGTSDAAAIVSGVAGMIQEQHEIQYGFIPESALVKAILIAGADDISLKGPDYYSGYGNINANQSLNLLTNGSIESLMVSLDNPVTFQIDIPTQVSSLKLVAVWTDPAAELDAARALVNDVDMELTGLGNTWYPWILDSGPGAVVLDKPATQGSDHLNNVEMIELTTPEAGSYTVSLKPFSLTSAQKVHIAWKIQSANNFQWNYPLAGDQLLPDVKIDLHWNHNLPPETPAQLQWSYDLLDWSEEPLDLSKSTQKWQVPDRGGILHLQVMINGSAQPLGDIAIGNTPQVEVGFNCDYAFSLEWESIAEATAYEVYEMGAQLMKKLITTNDTSVTITKGISNFYAVAPVFSGQEGKRSIALNSSTQGAFCYFDFFQAQRTIDDRLLINIKLSTAHDVSRLVVLKSYNDIQNQVLFDINPAGVRDFYLYDELLDPGLQTYQAILYTQQGDQFTSDLSELLVEATGKAILFPNPLQNDIYLNILSSGIGQRIQFFDREGKLILEKDLFAKLDYVIVQDFPPGLYFYRLLGSKGIIDKGKFILLP